MALCLLPSSKEGVRVGQDTARHSGVVTVSVYKKAVNRAAVELAPDSKCLSSSQTAGLC